MKKFLLPFLILCAILVVAMLWLEWQMGHLIMKVTPSPTGKHIAASYLNGNPPYGELVEIYSGLNPVGKYFGQTVYSDECGQTELQWVSEDHLLISCQKPKSIVIKRATTRDITVEIKPLDSAKNMNQPNP